MSLSLAPIFTDGMMLQRELQEHIWGTAEPGSRVEVRIQGQGVTCEADVQGAWHCTLAPLVASDAETMEVTSGSERLTLTDVAVGEVFVAAGQSNME